EFADHPSEGRGRRRVRRAQSGSGRRGEGGGAADARRRAGAGARRRADRLLRHLAVAAEGAALGRFRKGTAAAADGEIVQAAAEGPVLGEQDVKDCVRTLRLSPRTGRGRNARKRVPGEGDSPRIQLLPSSRRVPLTPTLSPQAG